MNRMLAVRRVSALLLGVLALGACTDAFIEPKIVEQTQVDDRLTLSGRVCTRHPDPSGFPVKVLILVDKSGSMCVSDPPGSQETMGFCERVAPAVLPPNVTKPGRVLALEKLVQQFAGHDNVRVRIVPFETNIQTRWPNTTNGDLFMPVTAAPGGVDINNYVANLQANLGKGTDYQGALAAAYADIAQDIHNVEQQDPALLPRTRYVVVFLTDGTPYPRCSANDSLSIYADSNHPELTWADSSSAVEFCNELDADVRRDVFGDGSPGTDEISSFAPGTDRNQNYQLFSYVDQLMELKETSNIGDIRLHTVLLFNRDAVEACNALGTNSAGRPLCEDLYGTYPNVPPDQYPDAAKAIARWTLSQMALRGNGIFQEFNGADIQSLSLGALDYSSLESPWVMKTLMLQPLRSVPGEENRVVDSDGDGVPDERDNSFTFGTSPFTGDSDQDCFSDDFELRHLDDGFLPGNDVDQRGCDLSDTTRDCSCQDTDGDGLPQYAEDFLGIQRKLVDTDADGVPDGLEARFGLEPKERRDGAGAIDTDGDGIRDLDEFLAGSDPTRQDRAFYEKHGFQYEVVTQPHDDGTTCYEFKISNIQLVTPPPHASSKQGYNLFKVWFAQAPVSGVATDFGVWEAACAWAQYDPPQVREPRGAELALPADAFHDADFFTQPDVYLTSCAGIAP